MNAIKSVKKCPPLYIKWETTGNCHLSALLLHNPINDVISIIFIFKIRLMLINTHNFCCTAVVFYLCACACLNKYLSFYLS